MPEPRIVVAVVWSSVVAVAASGCAADASWPRADGSGEASLSSVIASDAFTRIGAEGWGAADLGGTWSTFQGAPSDYWVDGSLGDIRVRTAGVDQGCWLPDTSASDVQVSFAVQTSVLATAGDLSAAAVFRDGPGLGNLYAGRLIFGADHTLEVTLEEKVGADWLVLGGPVAVPGEHVASQRYRVRARATG